MINVDELDKKIIGYLQDDSRRPFVEIAKHLSVSEGTIRKRVADMLKSKDITKFTLLLGNNSVSAVMAVNVSGKKTGVIAKEIKELYGVRQVYELAGEYDVFCIITAYSI
ncbi:Lrp/AsnC family transcriptional regulator, partial [Candidatus Micrarchaeota archaeon]|nr:Lrp/AsnC family transcriptional regulator [Candidatus Micrarchaeota archaeon]